MEIISKPLSELTPYENNPRKNDDAVKYVAESIQQFGFKVPIIIDKNSVIVAGHTRYKAAAELGLKEVPCIVADDLTEEQIRAFRLADNKVAEKAEWDYELLNAELDEIIGIDMDSFGFEFDELENIEPINDQQYEDTKTFEYKLKFGNKQVIMTEEEYQALLQRYDDYIEENGVSYGFVRSLVQNG